MNRLPRVPRRGAVALALAAAPLSLPAATQPARQDSSVTTSLPATEPDTAAARLGRLKPAFARERFVYAAGGRRDPFTPPAGRVLASTPVYGDDVAGILHHERSDLSVVLLRAHFHHPAGGRAGSAPGPAGPIRLRQGEVVAGRRVAEIHEDRVVLEADTEAEPVRTVLRIRRTGSGAPGCGS